MRPRRGPKPLAERPGSIPGSLIEELRGLPHDQRSERIRAFRIEQIAARRAAARAASEREPRIPANHPQRERILEARAARKRRSS